MTEKEGQPGKILQFRPRERKRHLPNGFRHTPPESATVSPKAETSMDKQFMRVKEVIRNGINGIDTVLHALDMPLTSSHVEEQEQIIRNKAIHKLLKAAEVVNEDPSAQVNNVFQAKLQKDAARDAIIEHLKTVGHIYGFSIEKTPPTNTIE